MHKVAQYRARHLQGLQFWATQYKFSPPCSQCFHCDNTVVADDTTRWLQWEMLALCQHDATGPGPWLWVPRHHARLQTRWGRRRPVAAPHGPQPQGGTEYLRPTAGMKGWEEHHCHHDQSMALTGRHPQAMPRAGLLCWERPWTAEITSEQKVLLVPPSSTVYTHKSHGCWKNGVAQLYPAEDGICSVRRTRETYKPCNTRLPRIIWYFTWDKALQQDRKHWQFLLLWFVFTKLQNPLKS